MDLEPFLNEVRRELATAADPEGQNRAVAERMAEALTPTMKLMLLNVLSTAADDITIDLAPGSVEVRLRGGEPSFVVTPPMAEQVVAESTGRDATPEPESATVVPSDPDDGPMSRINMRMSEHLKTRVEAAAEREGRSVNAWLVRAAAIVLDQRDLDSTPSRVQGTGGNRFTGWVG